MASITQRAPALAEHIYEDRDWLWYCGPSLQKAPAVREMLKQLGFRFAPSGHRISLEGGDVVVGSWGNSCLRPTFRKRSQPRHQAVTEAATDDGCEDFVDIYREMLTT